MTDIEVFLRTVFVRKVRALAPKKGTFNWKG